MKPKSVFLLCCAVLCVCERQPAATEKAPAAHDHPHPHDGKGEHAHTERVALGDVKLGSATVAVFQLSRPAPGGEGDFDLDFPAGSKLPSTLRGWVGLESAQGALKVRFAKETDTRMHGHPEFPDPMPAGSKLWLEVEEASGTVRASVAIVR
jgi:hypothetical protein